MMKQTRDVSGPTLVFANFASDLAVGLEASEVLDHWAKQAPRKMWLLRPGDVLLTPVPLSDAFQRYAAGLLDMPMEAAAVVAVPSLPGVCMAEAVSRAGLMEQVRELVRRRPGISLLPTALDSSSVAFARDLGVPVSPYGMTGPSQQALSITSLLNTKSGFRDVAATLGIRLPAGSICHHADLGPLVEHMVRDHGQVVLKPDRSAGGHGLMFLSAAQPQLPEAAPGLDGMWVVEERLDVAHSVSIQLCTTPRGTTAVYSGEMRTRDGSFTGYEAPLRGRAGTAAGELEHWGTKIGDYLARHGYAGPFSLDAVVTQDGTLFANESNVRRTATTTPHAMVTRLARTAGVDAPAWLLASRGSAKAHTFAQAVQRLEDCELAWTAERGEGVVFYADGPADGRSWRYAVISTSSDRLATLERRLAQTMTFEP
ncbi:peptide ligase PGM1-related protein [Streptomyces pristinaespiralis]|uniref:preATP grasp domain-containing protein n=1 Tax=Streptomyces pristinaespiralis TaxID=38300 RepID=UPI0033C4E5CF